MRNRSDSAAKSTRSSSTSDLKQGMGIWVWSRRPARIMKSHGDGSYEVEYLGDTEESTRVDRNDLDPMDPQDRLEYLERPRLEPDRGGSRTPLRKFMDEWPISRAQMIKVLEFSPPKVDRLIAEPQLSLDVAVLMGILFEVEVDPEVLPENERPYLEDAMQAAKEGAQQTSAPRKRGRPRKNTEDGAGE
ncbi:MAG: hypothetical protein KY468_13825 [Armatimonadetes bacterium]|nr:hypothetical protein [Armatimonadota bacterium]